MPRIQVSTFQKIALKQAASRTVMLMCSGATMSLPIVVATATPKMNGPTKFARAVISRAICGRMARDEIMVATMLLES